jgi:hypothetical protein
MKRGSVRKSATGQIAKKRWDATAVIHQNIYSEQGLAE